MTKPPKISRESSGVCCVINDGTHISFGCLNYTICKDRNQYSYKQNKSLLIKKKINNNPHIKTNNNSISIICSNKFSLK